MTWREMSNIDIAGIYGGGYQMSQTIVGCLVGVGRRVLETQTERGAVTLVSFPAKALCAVSRSLSFLQDQAI